METNFSIAWKAFQSSKEYKSIEEVLNDKGIVYPYSDNIINRIFCSGYTMSGVTIEVIPKQVRDDEKKKVNDAGFIVVEAIPDNIAKTKRIVDKYF